MVIRRFYACAVEQGWVKTNPALGIKAPRAKHDRAETLSFLEPSELAHLLAAVPQDDQIKSRRDRALLALMGLQGPRTVELHRANVRDLVQQGNHWGLRVEATPSPHRAVAIGYHRSSALVVPGCTAGGGGSSDGKQSLVFDGRQPLWGTTPIAAGLALCGRSVFGREWVETQQRAQVVYAQFAAHGRHVGVAIGCGFAPSSRFARSCRSENNGDLRACERSLRPQSRARH